MTKEEILKLSPQEIQNLVESKVKKINKYESAIYLYKSAVGDLYEELIDIRACCPHDNITAMHIDKCMLDACYITYECEDCGYEWQELVRNENWSKEMKDK